MGIRLWINAGMMRANDIVTENLKRWMAASEKLNTQAAVARAAKVGQSHISRILRGEANPTVGMLEAIAHAFRRSLIDLLTPPGAAYVAELSSSSIRAQEPLPDEFELLRGYHNASPEVREIMLIVAKNATGSRASRPDSGA